MNNDESIRLLAALAERLREDPQFMAHTLAAYQRRERLDDAALARWLGAAPEMLVRLALCRRPESNAPDFAERARELADYTLIDETRLIALIRRADSLIEPSPHAGQPGSIADALAAIRHWTGTLARPPVPVVASTILLIAALSASVLIWQMKRTALEPIIARHDPAPVITSPTPTPDAALATKPTPPELVTQARVRLADYQTLRDVTEAGRGERKPIELPAARARLALELPERSVKGLYRFSIVDADGNTLKAAQERSRDGKTLTITINLKRLAGKASRLGVGRVGEAPYFYPVVIGNPKTTSK
jgi:hypothetical protein